MVPRWRTSKSDIFFNFNLSDDTMVSTGAYNFDAEPVESLCCETHTFLEEAHKNCTTDFKAKFRFPNGGIGVVESTLRGSTIWLPSSVIVTNKEVVVPDNSLPPRQERVLKRELSPYGILFDLFWHRIITRDNYITPHQG